MILAVYAIAKRSLKKIQDFNGACQPVTSH